MLRDYALTLIGEDPKHDMYNKNRAAMKDKSTGEPDAAEPSVSVAEGQKQRMESARQKIFGCLERLYEQAGDTREFSLDKFNSRTFIGVELRSLLKGLQEADRVCGEWRLHQEEQKQAAKNASQAPGRVRRERE